MLFCLMLFSLAAGPAIPGAVWPGIGCAAGDEERAFSGRGIL